MAGKIAQNAGLANRSQGTAVDRQGVFSDLQATVILIDFCIVVDRDLPSSIIFSGQVRCEMLFPCLSNLNVAHVEN